ncbi:hypothetical protein [Knoellia sinensis]|uniref:hypothetical protein n=1 Tax=Knoellia sinensis TaxID=136100 RepID=UPI0012EC25D4|nr:hypothetical protein [Knoellia sinensis]
MTRRSRRASSVPQRVGSDEGLTSSRPSVKRPDPDPSEAAPSEADSAKGDAAEATARAASEAGGRHTGGKPRPKRRVDQTTDDTDEGWGEQRDREASARWLRENRPPHWD